MVSRRIALSELLGFFALSALPTFPETQDVHKRKIAIVGDSLLVGASTSMLTTGEKLRVSLLKLGEAVRIYGHVGATFAGIGDNPITESLGRDASYLRGAIVVVVLGSNDVLGASLMGTGQQIFREQIRSSFNALNSLLARYSVYKAAIISLPAIEQSPAFQDNAKSRQSIRELRQTFDKAIASVIANPKWSQIPLSIDASCFRETMPDGLHPNDKGIECLATAYSDAVASFIVKCR